MTARPLVITLSLDEAAQARFDAERTALFPPGRTVVGAHVTLFHALPGDEAPRVLTELEPVARRDAFDVEVPGLLFLGRGVAYRLHADELMEVHARLRVAWVDLLTPQDRQPFRPHVTVQNKVAPEEARRTLAAVQAAFTPFRCRATGIAVWRYDGGPWTALRRLPFQGPPG